MKSCGFVDSEDKNIEIDHEIELPMSSDANACLHRREMPNLSFQWIPVSLSGNSTVVQFPIFPEGVQKLEVPVFKIQTGKSRGLPSHLLYCHHVVCFWVNKHTVLSLTRKSSRGLQDAWVEIRVKIIHIHG